MSISISMDISMASPAVMSSGTDRKLSMPCAAAPMLYCGSILPHQPTPMQPLISMPPPPLPPSYHQHHHHKHQHQQQQLQHHRLPLPTAATMVSSMAASTDSAYASHYASRYASAQPSAQPSAAPSGSVSPVKSAPRLSRPLHQTQPQMQQLQLQPQPQQKRPQQQQQTVSDSCYASRVGSAMHSRAHSPNGCSRIRLGSSSVATAAVSASASTAASAAASAGQSRRASRAPSPTGERKKPAVFGRASPYAVVLPRGQARLLDETSALQLCRRSLQEELESAVRWLGALDWTSAAAFEAASDEAAVMEDEFRGSYDREPPTASASSAAVSDAADATDAAAAEDTECRIVLADTLLSMVEAAWTDEQEAENELSIAGVSLQTQPRCSKPKKEDAIYNVRYKTLPCLHWQKNRTCPTGDHCHFAHGPQELRQPQRHPKFKTQICQNYRRTGKCLFGNRCFFKHTEE